MDGIGAPFAMEVHSGIARIVRGGGRRLWREALERRAGLDQGAIHGEVLIGQEPRAAGLADHNIKEAAGHVMGQQPVPIRAEGAVVPPGLLQVHVQEPPEQDVIVQAFAEQPIRADRVQGDQELGLQETLRRNRGPAHVAVHLVEDLLQRLEGLVCHLRERPNRMAGRHAGVWRDVAPHGFLAADLTAHRQPPGWGERCIGYNNVHHGSLVTRASFSTAC